MQFILGTEEDAEHVAHELFTELDEICVKDGKDAEWKETARSVSPRVGLLAVIPGHKAPWSFVHCTASLIPQLSCPFRWLKFEEDVEDGGERWSKPYVATLSLHSLFELRSCIINGSVLLDMHADCIEEIAGSSFFQIASFASCKICKKKKLINC